MAVRKKESNIAINDNTIAQILGAIEDLLRTHGERIGEAIEKAEDKALTVGFSAAIDCSESKPIIDVGFRYAETVTDRRKIQCEDGNQETWSIMSPAELKKQKEAQAKAEKAAKKAAAKAGDEASVN